jgi:hypothetical protein
MQNCAAISKKKNHYSSILLSQWLKYKSITHVAHPLLQIYSHYQRDYLDRYIPIAATTTKFPSYKRKKTKVPLNSKQQQQQQQPRHSQGPATAINGENGKNLPPRDHLAGRSIRVAKKRWMGT